MFASVCPPEGLGFGFEFEVDAFWEVGEEKLDVCSDRGIFVLGHGHVGAEDAAFAGFAGALLAPVEGGGAWVDGYADAEAEWVTVVVGVGRIAGLDEGLLVRAVEIASVHT